MNNNDMDRKLQTMLVCEYVRGLVMGGFIGSVLTAVIIAFVVVR